MQNFWCAMNVKIERKYKKGLLAKENTPTHIVPFNNKIIDITNFKYGKLTVLKYLGINYRRSSVWECVCDCGKLVRTSSTVLRTGSIKSCGCITVERLKKLDRCRDEIEVGVNRVTRSYKRGAKNRNLEFNLSFDQVKDIIFQNCHYCGIAPKNICKLTKKRFITYSGIDRIINDLGYLPDNVLPCCSECNTMKSDMNLTEFCEYVNRLIKHTKTWIKP